MRWLTCCFLLLFVPATAWSWPARTEFVLDGDTIAVRTPSGQRVRIRIYGIDAPEFGQPYGPQAKQRMIELAAGRLLDIEPRDRDRYGRTVAVVRAAAGPTLNEIMVAEGLAWFYGRYCHSGGLCRSLRDLQDAARSERRGLWRDPDPQPPETWRREHAAARRGRRPRLRLRRSFGRRSFGRWLGYGSALRRRRS